MVLQLAHEVLKNKNLHSTKATILVRGQRLFADTEASQGLQIAVRTGYLFCNNGMHFFLSCEKQPCTALTHGNLLHYFGIKMETTGSSIFQFVVWIVQLPLKSDCRATCSWDRNYNKIVTHRCTSYRSCHIAPVKCHILSNML